MDNNRVLALDSRDEYGFFKLTENKPFTIECQTVDNLGIKPEHIRLMNTRTDKVPNTSATAASSGTDLNSAAIKNACDQITARLRKVAAKHLGIADADIDKIVFDDGQCLAQGKESVDSVLLSGPPRPKASCTWRWLSRLPAAIRRPYSAVKPCYCVAEKENEMRPCPSTFACLFMMLHGKDIFLSFDFVTQLLFARKI